VTRRAHAATAVALLLLLAGCGGVVPGASDSPPTDAPSTDPAPNVTVIPEERLADDEFPDGFSRTGIDISTARERSVAYLRTEPVSGDALERFRPGAYADYQYEATAAAVRFRLDVHNGYADVTQSDVYVASEVRHTRSGRNGRVSFDARNGSVAKTRYRAADSMWAVVSRILTVGEFRAVRTVRVDGERRIRYAVVDVVVRNASGVQGYLVVDEDGIVRQARLLYVQVGEPKRFQYDLVARSDRRVAAPAWLPAARANRTAETDSQSTAAALRAPTWRAS
jgi:RNase P/RNase MRP subunit p29